MSDEIDELINDIIDATRDIERGIKGARSERGHARATLERKFEALEAELAAPNAPMECGHAARYAVTEFAAKNGCAICDRDEWQELAIDNASTIQGDQVDLAAARKSAAVWKQAARWWRRNHFRSYPGVTFVHEALRYHEIVRRLERKYRKAPQP